MTRPPECLFPHILQAVTLWPPCPGEPGSLRTLVVGSCVVPRAVIFSSLAQDLLQSWPFGLVFPI